MTSASAMAHPYTPPAARVPRQAGPVFRTLLLAALLAGLAAAALGGCSTARERQEPENIFGNLRFRNEEARAYFSKTYRSGNLYHDFRPVMVVDVIFKDRRYRRTFLATLKERYLLDEPEHARMTAEALREFATQFVFVVLVYGGSNRPVRINRADSNWKIFLRDDDGDLLRPDSIKRIKSDSPTYIYLQRYFVGFDRWSEPYLVRFPKLEKALLGKNPGPNPIDLMVTGIEGTVTLRWEDVEVFYGDAEPGAAPETPSPPHSAENGA